MSIELVDVEKVFRGSDVALRFPRIAAASGEELCIVGASGSGKTTLLHLIAGLLLPDRGRVLVDGTEISSLTETARDRFRARSVGYVFQVFHLLPAYTVLENVLLPLHFAGVPSREARARAEELLARLGLGSHLMRRPVTLSVGEQQRIAIARAVACRPRVLLADEPTASLDTARADETLTLLREVAKESAAILVVVTHDERVRASFQRVERLEVAS
jgi:putative ABC transport system ATP-binding protein